MPQMEMFIGFVISVLLPTLTLIINKFWVLKNFYVSGNVQLASSQYDCGCNELECKREGKKILTMKCQETFEFFDSCWEKDQNYQFCEECFEAESLEIKMSMVISISFIINYNFFAWNFLCFNLHLFVIGNLKLDYLLELFYLFFKYSKIFY